MIVPTSVKVGIAGFLKSPSCFDNWGFFRFYTQSVSVQGHASQISLAITRPGDAIPHHQTLRLVLRQIPWLARWSLRPGDCQFASYESFPL